MCYYTYCTVLITLWTMMCLYKTENILYLIDYSLFYTYSIHYYVINTLKIVSSTYMDYNVLLGL